MNNSTSFDGSPPPRCRARVAGARESRGDGEYNTMVILWYEPPVSDFKGHQLRMHAGLPRPCPLC